MLPNYPGRIKCQEISHAVRCSVFCKDRNSRHVALLRLRSIFTLYQISHQRPRFSVTSCNIYYTALQCLHWGIISSPSNLQTGRSLSFGSSQQLIQNIPDSHSLFGSHLTTWECAICIIFLFPLSYFSMKCLISLYDLTIPNIRCTHWLERVRHESGKLV